MKYIAGAIVVAVLIAADVAGDLGYMSEADANNWSGYSGLALVLFALALLFGDE